MKKQKRIAYILAVLFAVTLLGSCDKPYPGEAKPGEGGHRLFLYYAAGQNSLTGYIQEDIEELTGNYLPLDRESDNIVLMYCRLGKNRFDTDPKPSYLIRLHRNLENEAVLDTLVGYSKDVNAADAGTVNMILNEVQDRFPDRKYGMLISSHATGWLPTGYYGNESSFEHNGNWNRIPKKSIGQDSIVPDPGTGQKVSIEMDLKEFADAIPMHMDYIIFDSCLMGGIEVAYQLRYVCDQVGFSQTEILADGFNYKTILNGLLLTRKNYAERICRDYFEQYETKTGWENSATVSLVRTRHLDRLAGTCRDLTEKYRTAIGTMYKWSVQRYYRYDYDYFFDLKDIYAHAGASPEELEELQAAMDSCIIYKAATEEFMLDYGGFEIRDYSGLSMYLPDSQKTYLNNYYKTLDWNIATNLVK